MKGLLLNSYYCFWESGKIMLFLFVAMGMLVIVTANATAQELFAYLMMTSLPINSIIASKNDDVSKWNRYELILPVKRAEIVKAKYLSYVAWILAGAIITLIIAVITIFFHDGANIVGDISKLYSMFALGIGLSIFVGGLFYPLAYSIGMDKGETIMIISFIVSTIVSVFLINVLNIFISNFLIRMGIFIGVYLTFFGVSYILSINIYKKKEL